MKRVIVTAILAVVVGMACLIPAALESKIPILMYHDIVEDDAPINSMCITKTRFQQDMAHLKQNGYTALLTEDLVKIRAGESPMPEKPVIVTFDDGYESNYRYAYPVLQENHMKAIIAVVAGTMRMSEAEANQHMLTWAQCKEMCDSGTVEIGCHSYALHNNEHGGMFQRGQPNGIQRLHGENQAQYQKRVGGDLHKGVQLIRQQVGKPCVYFSYPFGATDRWMTKILVDQGILMTTTTVNRGATAARGLYGLPRYHMTMDRSAAELLR